MYKLDTPEKSEYPVLLAVWESSVQATHHFLEPGDIESLKNIIRENDLFQQVTLICVRDIHNTILGFIGVSEDNIEMLFVHADARRQGIGKILLQSAIKNSGVTKVDVNEQNLQAILFYERSGFKIISRSDLDENGKPYPILHMQLFPENAKE